jgi:hypothetical protein
MTATQITLALLIALVVFAAGFGVGYAAHPDAGGNPCANTPSWKRC